MFLNFQVRSGSQVRDSVERLDNLSRLITLILIYFLLDISQCLAFDSLTTRVLLFREGVRLRKENDPMKLLLRSINNASYSNLNYAI